MTDPIDRFCRMLSHPELGDANELTGLCCSFLGVEEAFGGKMSPKTMDDVRAQMRHLVDRIGLRADVLILGVFHSLVDFYELGADPNEASGKIDNQMAARQKLLTELEKPREEREDNRSDERLCRLLSIFEDGMSRLPAMRARCESVATALWDSWNQEFTREYWAAWRASETNAEIERLRRGI